MNYLIPSLIGGLVDGSSKSKLTDDYKTKADRLNNAYLTPEDSVKTRPPVKAIPGFEDVTGIVDWKQVGDDIFLLREIELPTFNPLFGGGVRLNHATVNNYANQIKAALEAEGITLPAQVPASSTELEPFGRFESPYYSITSTRAYRKDFRCTLLEKYELQDGTYQKVGGVNGFLEVKITTKQNSKRDGTGELVNINNAQHEVVESLHSNKLSFQLVKGVELGNDLFEEYLNKIINRGDGATYEFNDNLVDSKSFTTSGTGNHDKNYIIKRHGNPTPEAFPGDQTSPEFLLLLYRRLLSSVKKLGSPTLLFNIKEGAIGDYTVNNVPNIDNLIQECYQEISPTVKVSVKVDRFYTDQSVYRDIAALKKLYEVFGQKTTDAVGKTVNTELEVLLASKWMSGHNRKKLTSSELSAPNSISVKGDEVVLSDNEEIYSFNGKSISAKRILSDDLVDVAKKDINFDNIKVVEIQEPVSSLQPKVIDSKTLTDWLRENPEYDTVMQELKKSITAYGTDKNGNLLLLPDVKLTKQATDNLEPGRVLKSFDGGATKAVLLDTTIGKLFASPAETEEDDELEDFPVGFGVNRGNVGVMIAEQVYDDKVTTNGLVSLGDALATPAANFETTSREDDIRRILTLVGIEGTASRKIGRNYYLPDKFADNVPEEEIRELINKNSAVLTGSNVKVVIKGVGRSTDGEHTLLEAIDLMGDSTHVEGRRYSRWYPGDYTIITKAITKTLEDLLDDKNGILPFTLRLIYLSLDYEKEEVYEDLTEQITLVGPRGLRSQNNPRIVSATLRKVSDGSRTLSCPVAGLDIDFPKIGEDAIWGMTTANPLKNAKALFQLRIATFLASATAELTDFSRLKIDTTGDWAKRASDRTGIDLSYLGNVKLTRTASPRDFLSIQIPMPLSNLLPFCSSYSGETSELLDYQGGRIIESDLYTSKIDSFFASFYDEVFKGFSGEFERIFGEFFGAEKADELEEKELNTNDTSKPLRWFFTGYYPKRLPTLKDETDTARQFSGEDGTVNLSGIINSNFEDKFSNSLRQYFTENATAITNPAFLRRSGLNEADVNKNLGANDPDTIVLRGDKFKNQPSFAQYSDYASLIATDNGIYRALRLGEANPLLLRIKKEGSTVPIESEESIAFTANKKSLTSHFYFEEFKGFVSSLVNRELELPEITELNLLLERHRLLLIATKDGTYSLSLGQQRNVRGLSKLMDNNIEKMRNLDHDRVGFLINGALHQLDFGAKPSETIDTISGNDHIYSTTLRTLPVINLRDEALSLDYKIAITQILLGVNSELNVMLRIYADGRVIEKPYREVTDADVQTLVSGLKLIKSIPSSSSSQPQFEIETQDATPIEISSINLVMKK